MPLFYLDVFEMREILKAQGRALDGVCSSIELIIDNNFIMTADEATIKDWETFLALVNPPGMTLEERRAQVAAMLYRVSHIGEPEIRELFKFFSNGSIDVGFSRGVIELAIDLAPGEVLSVAAFLQVLSRRIPAHLSLRIVFQTKVGLRIRTHGQGYPYRSPMTGIPFAGTWPKRNTLPGLDDRALEVETDTNGFPYNAPAAGTRPYRNIPAGIERDRSQIRAHTDEYGYKVAASGTHEAGTIPGHAVEPGIEDRGIRLDPSTEGFSYVTPITGKAASGKFPERASKAELTASGVQVGAKARGYPYAVSATGQTDAGTTPKREAAAAAESGRFYTTAEAEGFRYTVKLCGTSYCKS